MRIAGLDEAQGGIKFARRNIKNFRYSDDTTLMAESRELKSVLMKIKEESGKVCLKLNIMKTKITASGPITSWQIDGETPETVANFIFAAAAAKSLQSCLTLCNPIDGSLPGSHPWDSPVKNTGVGCHFLLQCAYLRLLIFLPAILIPPCASSSPAFLMMYSAYKLNKQGDNIQP